MDEADQYSRRNCVVLHGIPAEGGEDTDKIATDFFNEHLNIKINKFDIDRSHRLPSSKKPLIMKFVRHNIKSKVYAARKNLKNEATR